MDERDDPIDAMAPENLTRLAAEPIAELVRREKYQLSREHLRQIEAEDAKNPVTFRCATCLDTGFISGPCSGRHRRRLSSGLMTCGGCTVSWFCTCEAGEAMESGYWLDRIYPFHGPRRRMSEHGHREFEEYERQDAFRASRMKERVNQLLDRKSED